MLCAVHGSLALLIAGAAVTVTLWRSGWNFTALPRVNSNTALGAHAKAIDPKFDAVRSGAYDGQFSWGIAVDPLASNSVHRTFDKPSYRYGHPLYGWLAWLWSFGDSSAAPFALAIAGLASVFAAGWGATALGLSRGSRGWEGLVIAVNPGVIFAAQRDLSEPLGVALLLGALAASTSGRRKLAWVCFALLPLAKEPLILALLAAVVWEVARARPRAAACLATAAIPALAWWTYARVHFGAWFTTGGSALAPPLFGWSQSIERNLASYDRVFARSPSQVAAVALLVVLVLVAFTGVRALRLRGPIDVACLALVVLAFCLAANATMALTTALRNTVFLFALAPFVVVGRTIGSRDE